MYFLPAYPPFVVHETRAASERTEAADHHHRDREPERHHAPPHGGDAEQRDEDPAEAVGPAEVELRRVVKNGEDEQHHVDRRVGEREVLQPLERDHGPSSLAMWRSGPSASCGQASTSRG